MSEKSAAGIVAENESTANSNGACASILWRFGCREGIWGRDVFGGVGSLCATAKALPTGIFGAQQVRHQRRKFRRLA